MPASELDAPVLGRTRHRHRTPVAPQDEAVRVPTRRNEELERRPAARLVAEPQRVRGVVEGVLDDGARYRTRVDAREGVRAPDPLAAVGALAVVESPVSRADLLPQPERRVRAQAI